MKEWILESRTALVLRVLLQMAFYGLVFVTGMMACEEWQRQDALRHAKDRQECIRGGGAWQEGRVSIFPTESCVRSR